MAPRRHLFDCRLAAREVEQRARQLLLFLEQRLEQVADLLDALQHLVRVEHEQAGVLRLEALLDLLPRHRGRHRRPRAGAQRVNVDRRLVLVVLAPVDEDASGAQLLQLLVHHKVRIFLFEELRQPFRHDLGLVVVDGRVQRHVELQTLGP